MITKQKVAQKENPETASRVGFALEIAELLRRRWFATKFDPPLDHRMAGLMFAVYAFSAMGQQISKKVASILVDAADTKTARKYVSRAIELGFFDVVKSTDDGRIDLLFPSKLLKQLIDEEMVHMNPRLAWEYMSESKKAAAREILKAARLKGTSDALIPGAKKWRDLDEYILEKNK